MDKQDNSDKAHCVNTAMRCTLIFTSSFYRLSDEDILAKNIIYECSFE